MAVSKIILAGGLLVALAGLLTLCRGHHPTPPLFETAAQTIEIERPINFVLRRSRPGEDLHLLEESELRFAEEEAEHPGAG